MLPNNNVKHFGFPYQNLKSNNTELKLNLYTLESLLKELVKVSLDQYNLKDKIKYKIQVHFSLATYL